MWYRERDKIGASPGVMSLENASNDRSMEDGETSTSLRLLPERA